MKTLIIVLAVVGALVYFGFVKVNPTRIQEAAVTGGKKLAQTVKQVDKTRLTNAAKRTATAVKEVAKETKDEYNRN